jgi:hypothetical protein
MAPSADMPPARRRRFGLAPIGSLALVCACGGEVTSDDFEDLSEPCVSLDALSDCGSVTLGLDGPVAAPCSWRVGLSVQEARSLTVALDCRVMRSGGCWDVDIDPEVAAFSLSFSGACCKQLEDERTLRIDVGIGCPPDP